MNRLLGLLLCLVLAVNTQSCKSDESSKNEKIAQTSKAKLSSRKSADAKAPTLKRLKEAQAVKAAPLKKETQTLADANGLNWYTIDDLDKLKAKGDKKVMIDIYTDWCGWCKVMDKKTFTDSGVIDYLNENYYVVKFNAEQKAPVQYGGKTYSFVKAGRKGVNELAQEMLNGRLGYPTIVYLDADHNKVKVSPGYKDPAKLMGELKVL